MVFCAFTDKAVLLHTAVFLLDLLKLRLLSLLSAVPALFAHLLVDPVLHAQGVVQRGAEGLMHIGGRRLDRTVKVQVTHALGAHQNVFHNVSVAHIKPP